VKGAQIIVCWEHDWKNCPKEIEVLELKSLIRKLKHEEAEQATIEEGLSPKAVKIPLSITSDYATATGFLASKKEKEKPEYETSWNARLEWVGPGTRELAEKLVQRLEHELPVKGKPRFRWYSLYRQEPFVRKNDIATILVGRKTLRLSIRTNPKKFSDTFGLFKPMAGFFYDRGEERRAFVTPDNLEAVVSVARGAYQGLVNKDEDKVTFHFNNEDHSDAPPKPR
jgi:hypothetical protein